MSITKAKRVAGAKKRQGSGSQKQHSDPGATRNGKSITRQPNQKERAMKKKARAA